MDECNPRGFSRPHTRADAVDYCLRTLSRVDWSHVQVAMLPYDRSIFVSMGGLTEYVGADEAEAEKCWG